jgi:hypothetical protein
LPVSGRWPAHLVGTIDALFEEPRLDSVVSMADSIESESVNGIVVDGFLTSILSIPTGLLGRGGWRLQHHHSAEVPSASG